MEESEERQNVTHPPNTEMTETVEFQTMMDGEDEQTAPHPPKTELTGSVESQTKTDGKEEENETRPPKIDMNEAVGFENKWDGENDQTAPHPPKTELTGSVEIQTKTDGKEEQNESQPPKIELNEAVGFENKWNGKDDQTALHPPKTELTGSIEIQTKTDGVQSLMTDIESPNNVNKKSQDDCEKLQRTHVKLKNKNTKLRRSIKDMNRTLSQEHNLVSDLQRRETHLVSELKTANCVNKQLQSDYETLQSTNNKIMKENTMLQQAVQDKNQSLSREMETVSDLQKREMHLVSELETANAMKNQLQSDCEKLQSTNTKMLKENTMLRNSVHDKDQSLSDERKTVSDLRERAESLELELESTNAVNKLLHSDIETLQNMYNNIQRKNEQLEKSLKDMDRALSQGKETISDLQKRLEFMQNQVSTYREREARLQTAYDGEVSKSGIQTKQILDLQVQRDDSLNRLSKLAGDMLTHENTNITDLSDANRPTKLSETYSELYDNEWTDAFEELTGRGLTDIFAVGKLLDMLLLSFRKCRDVTWERYQTLKYTASTVDIAHVLSSTREFTEYEAKKTAEISEPMELEHQRELHGKHGTEMENYPVNCAIDASRETEILCNQDNDGERTSQPSEEHFTCSTTMTVEQEREMKRIWRTATTALMDEAVRHLHRVLLTKFDISIKDWPNTSKYLARCIDLCWKMGVQEKPMHLDACDETGDGCEKIFNHEKFRAYMKTGKKVAFVVWPALFMHEGGAMLVKGIAQGCQ